MDLLQRIFGSASSEPENPNILDLKDYPKTEYTAYWEIGIGRQVDGSCKWIARILTRGQPVHTEADHPDPFLLEENRGDAPDEWHARRNSQLWVQAQMVNYRREMEALT